MKKLCLILLIVLASVVAGLVMTHYPGYLFIGIQNWRIESTLWLGLLLLTAALWLLQQLLIALLATLRIRQNWNAWRARTGARKSHQLTSQGFCALAEAQWKTAEKYLLKAAKYQSSPLVAYLGAARAAQMQHATQKRDEYLMQASKADPSADIAVGLTQAQLQLDAKQLEQALATLQSLHHQQPKHPHVLLLLAKTHAAVGDWNSAGDLLPLIKRHQCLSRSEYNILADQIYTQQLMQHIKNGEASKAKKLWRSLEDQSRHDATHFSAYVRFLIHQGDEMQAAKMICQRTDTTVDPAVLDCAKSLRLSEAVEYTLCWAEKAAEHRPQQAGLLDLCGHLAAQCQLWGKAHTHYSLSVELEPTANKFFALAKIASRQQKHEQANAYVKQGIEYS